MTTVRFYDKDFDPGKRLIYSVICARYDGRWIFVRHNNKKTWEIPAGHIEDHELPRDAAFREVMEETGAIEFDLTCVATYSVKEGCKTGYGRLYFAEVKRLGDITDVTEIAERRLFDHIPENLTYPDIQPLFLRRTIEFLRSTGAY
jgi:8-oxo-dGTP diphosphatase